MSRTRLLLVAGEAMEPAAKTMEPAPNLVGAGCAGYTESVPDGAGSVAGMALDPVATAASNNPILTAHGQSTVICGGVQTANATVYLIDTVLMPSSM